MQSCNKYIAVSERMLPVAIQAIYKEGKVRLIYLLIYDRLPWPHAREKRRRSSEEGPEASAEPGVSFLQKLWLQHASLDQEYRREVARCEVQFCHGACHVSIVSHNPGTNQPCPARLQNDVMRCMWGCV